MNRVITSQTKHSLKIWDLTTQHCIEYGIIDGQLKSIRHSGKIQDNHLKYYKLLGKCLQFKQWVKCKWQLIIKQPYRLYQPMRRV